MPRPNLLETLARPTRIGLAAALAGASACAATLEPPAQGDDVVARVDRAPPDAPAPDGYAADRVLDRAAPDAALDAAPDATADAAPDVARPMPVVCSACETRAPRPTQANGDCFYNDYDCKVWPRWDCEQMRLYNRYARACDNYFTLAGGGCSDNVYDSLGNVQAHVDPARNPMGIRFNSGSLIVDASAGLARIMAWSMPTDHGVRSGWVDVCVVREPLLETASAAQPADPGGETSDWHIVACDPGSDCYGDYLDATGASLKVVQAGCAATGGENATDYLGRITGTTIEHLVSKIYNLPGHGYGSATNDLYPNNAGVAFHRYTSVHSVDVPLYDCARGAVRSSRTLQFLYGTVAGHYPTSTGDVVLNRRGWIAHPNLAAGVASTP